MGGTDENAAELKGALVGSQINQHTALAEKARLEAEAFAQSQRERQDPGLQNEYAATTSGMTVPQGAQLRGYVRGESVAPLTPNDDEGNVNASVPYARPDVSPEQERGYRSAIGALIANRIATGKTNAHQLTQGQGELLADAVRQKIAGTTEVPDQNQLRAALPGAGYREPYRGTVNAQGISQNQETGELTVEPEIHGAAVKALDALAGKRGRDATGKPPARITTIEWAAKNLFKGDMAKAAEWEATSKNKSPQALFLDVRSKLANANPLLARDPVKLDQATRDAIGSSISFAAPKADGPRRIRLDENGDPVE